MLPEHKQERLQTLKNKLMDDTINDFEKIELDVLLDEEKEVSKTPEEIETEKRLQAAREVGNTWKFEGKEFEMPVISPENLVTSKLFVPGTQEMIGLYEHVLSFQDDLPFVDYFAGLVYRRERMIREDWQTGKIKNSRKANAKLYDELVQGGSEILFDEDGSVLTETEMKRADMLGLTTELKSDVMDVWLDRLFTVKRHFPTDRAERLKAISHGSNTVQMIGYIGSEVNPAAVILFDYEMPNDDQRRDYEDKVRKPRFKTDGDLQVNEDVVDFKYQIKHARKHFKGVSGVSMLEPGKPYTPEMRDTFLKFFNPYWLVRTFEKLLDSLNATKK